MQSMDWGWVKPAMFSETALEIGALAERHGQPGSLIGGQQGPIGIRSERVVGRYVSRSIRDFKDTLP